MDLQKEIEELENAWKTLSPLSRTLTITTMVLSVLGIASLAREIGEFAGFIKDGVDLWQWVTSPVRELLNNLRDGLSVLLDFGVIFGALLFSLRKLLPGDMFIPWLFKKEEAFRSPEKFDAFLKQIRATREEYEEHLADLEKAQKAQVIPLAISGVILLALTISFFGVSNGSSGLFLAFWYFLFCIRIEAWFRFISLFLLPFVLFSILAAISEGLASAAAQFR